jgi:hypothetical protein
MNWNIKLWGKVPQTTADNLNTASRTLEFGVHSINARAFHFKNEVQVQTQSHDPVRRFTHR